MSNQIYLRIGKPKRFKEVKPSKPMNPILIWIIKWGIVAGVIYFFGGAILKWIIYSI